jgi:hypothetical protein
MRLPFQELHSLEDALVNFEAIQSGFTLTSNSWTTATLLHSWTVLNSRTVAYLKDASGFVHVRGAVTSGTTGTVAFILPAGFIPGQEVTYVTPGDTAGEPSVIVIDTSGNVTVDLGTGSTSAGLDLPVFLAEN